MTPPIAYLNGQFIPAHEAAVPVTDAGFVQGTTVAEQLRTFNGQLFRLDQHLDRLFRSLQLVGVDPGLDRSQFASIADRVARINHDLLAAGDDLGLSIFVTAGMYPTFAAQGSTGPLVGMHTYPLPFHFWADKYDTGQSLVTTGVCQVPADCWSPELKCRSRMHYYLADLEAREIDSTARALLLDVDGNVSEASTASIIMFNDGEGLVAPPEEKILPGISLGCLKELADQLSIPFSHRDIAPRELATAGEVLLCSTSPCVLPVTRFNGQPIQDGQPGDVFRRVLAAWGDLVGIDIAGQARQFSTR